MLALLTAIRNKIVGSALSADVGDRIYLDQYPAEQPITFPYVVYFIVSSVPQDTFREDVEDTLIQFSLFSASEGATEITGMYADLKALFKDCTLTITGDTHLSMVQEGMTTMVDDITTAAGTAGVKHWAVDYSILVKD